MILYATMFSPPPCPLDRKSSGQGFLQKNIDWGEGEMNVVRSIICPWQIRHTRQSPSGPRRGGAAIKYYRTMRGFGICVFVPSQPGYR